MKTEPKTAEEILEHFRMTEPHGWAETSGIKYVTCDAALKAMQAYHASQLGGGTKWLPYPENEPEESMECWVTITGRKDTTTLVYLKEGGCGFANEFVTAWKPFIRPIPYQVEIHPNEGEWFEFDNYPNWKFTPEIDKPYNVTCLRGDLIYVEEGFYDADGWYYFNEGGKHFFKSKIIAFRELPEPYQGGGEG